MFSFFLCQSFSKFLSIDFGSFQTKVFNVPFNGQASISHNLIGKRLTPTFVGFKVNKTFDAFSEEPITLEESKLLVGAIGEKAIDYSQVRPWLTSGYLPLFVDANEGRRKKLEERFDINSSAARVLSADLLPIFMQLIAREHSPMNEVDGVLVAVPAIYTIPQRKIIEDAIRTAGLACDGVIDDATAVAYTYAIDKTRKFIGKKKNILFVDVGATSVKSYVYNFELESQSATPIITRLSYVINTEIGGFEVTKAIRNYIIETKKLVGLTDAEIKRIDASAELLKKKLSISRKASEVCEDIQDIDITVTMDRITLEKLAAPLAEAVQNVMQEAIGEFEINDIEVIGGSSRIPLIANTIKQVNPDMLRHSLNCDEAVAQGVAYFHQFVQGISIYRPMMTLCNYSAHTISLKSGEEEYPFSEKGGLSIPFVEFSGTFNRLSFFYAEDEIMEGLEHKSFDYRLEVDEFDTNISIQFTSAPFDVEQIFSCQVNGDCRNVEIFIEGDYYNATKIYHVVMDKFDKERRLRILKKNLDYSSAKILKDIKHNATVRTFTNETQRYDVESRAKAAIKWMKENADNENIDEWRYQFYHVTELADPIYHRIEENITFHSYIKELAFLLKHATQYSMVEVPINRSFVGKKNIIRLQGAVDKAQRWLDVVVNATFSQPPWEDKEFSSGDVLRVYQELSNELDRIVKMKPYTGSEKGSSKKNGVLDKAIGWIKKKITTTEKSKESSFEGVLEDNQL